MSAVGLLALCVLFVFLVWLYLALVRFNAWRHSDASRRAKIARWLLQRGNNSTPPSITRVMSLVNRHLHGCLTSKRPVSEELVSVSYRHGLIACCNVLMCGRGANRHMVLITCLVCFEFENSLEFTNTQTSG